MNPEVSMAATVNPIDIQPRQVANKSDKKALLEAIRMTLGVQSAAIRHNTQTFNRNRYNAVARITDYEAMKDRARRTKENAIANLPDLVRQLESSVRANGGYFFLAKTAADANHYIRDVLLKHDVKLVVKSKSITSEEIRLNHSLEEVGIKSPKATSLNSSFSWPTSNRRTSSLRLSITRASASPRFSNANSRPTFPSTPAKS